MVTEPLSEKTQPGLAGFGCLALFFLPFLVIGSVAFYIAFLKPTLGILAARSWVETPCQVVASEVKEFPDSDGTTYAVQVSYTYRYQGRKYESGRYDFSTGSSSGREGKAEIVALYPPESRCLCWVDPADPTQAVIDRQFRLVHLPIGLFTLLFVAVGGGGMFWAVRTGLTSRKVLPLEPMDSPTGPLAAQAVAGLELKPTVSPGVALLGGVLLCLFWNGIVSIMVVKVVESWVTGEPEGCLTAFAVPFVLVGLSILYYTGRKFLELFNPRPVLRLSPAALTVGTPAYLEWRFPGSSAKVKKLTVVLEGREEATYRRGTDTKTDREVFATMHVVEADHPFTIAAGSVSLSLPLGSMHSFTAQRNKIVWTLKVHTEIPGWPDSNDDYDIQVRPGT